MDRFDLENSITNMHTIVDDLNDISFGILECGISQDETVNAIDGLAVILKLKIEKLFDTFVKVHKLDGYGSETFTASDCL
jgi:hypothetical protein